MASTTSSVLSVLFFFSSRRRHTRCLSDWSSDVCSSDLGDDSLVEFGSRFTTGLATIRAGRRGVARSEERRVGKECRSRWAQCHQKKTEQRDARAAAESIPEENGAYQRYQGYITARQSNH